MKPVRPTNPHEDSFFVEFGVGQPQYDPLPAFKDEDGLVLSEWEPTPEEREIIAKGGRIRLWTHTFHHPFQPVQMEAVRP